MKYIHGNECIIFFLRAIWCPEHNSAKNNYRSLISPFSLRTLFSDWALWRHRTWSVMSCEHGPWHCDVTFVDCSCTRELAQRQSSLVNNIREYRFFTTQKSWLNMLEINSPNNAVDLQCTCQIWCSNTGKHSNTVMPKEDMLDLKIVIQMFRYMPQSLYV